MTRLAVLTRLADERVADAVGGVVARLRECGFAVDVPVQAAEAVLVWADSSLGADDLAALVEAAPAVPVLVAGPTLAAHRDHALLTEAAGIVAARATPLHELRLRPGPDAGEVTARVDGDVMLTDSFVAIDKTHDDVEVLLTAMAGLDVHPVMTWRPQTGVGMLSLGTTRETLADPAYRRLVQRWVRHATGAVDAPPVRVGLLGFGAIGAEHAAAVTAVDGLALAGVCDTNPARVAVAVSTAPGVRGYDDADDLLAADVDLVVVSTPPDSHAEWALRALDAGKHVVVEKPFALTTAEVDEMLAAADGAGRLLTAYQNRRWDADYLTLKRVIRSGAIGAVFHYESFIGGFAHPCNYWHSDEDVSGGAAYDWGSHYLDWVLDLFPNDVEHVTATTQKRVWHDVTNADHTRVTVRFVDGVEAEFVHSDVAAALKPKWYVLGTRGAVVGEWRHEKVLGRNAIGALVEDPLAAADSPAVLRRHDADGSVTALALVDPPRHAFHRELADHLLSGAPMSVTAQGARRTVAVLEAAVASARDAGRPVVPS